MTDRTWIWLLWRLSLFLCLFHPMWNYADGQTRYTIPEELKRGSVVGNILKDLELRQSEVSERRLRIASEDGKQYFSVDLKKGELVVNDRIDREGLCGQNPSCVLALQVLIDNPLQLFRVEVDIQDINDNFPVFITSEHVLNIAESTTVGTRFPLKGAEDLDVGSNALKSYKLSPNEHFVLNLKSTKSGVKVPELMLQKPLDREKQPVHQLVLTAVDGGSPPRSGTTEIVINVLDINDNAPQFEKVSYELQLREDTAKESTVLVVKAIDLDSGENGYVSYSFAEHTPDDVLKTFLINSQSGVVSLGTALDYEQKRKYEFDIRATDKGTPPMEGHCTVIVEVQDVNDNSPEIIVTSLTSSLREDSPVGTVVALITPKDVDSGQNGKTTVRLAGKYPFKLTPSLSGHFALVTDATLDRETFPQYNIKILVSDAGTPPLKDEKEITVDILDTNDSPPRFSQSEYTAYVKENVTPGKLICSVSATDPDAGENAKISYSILDSGDSPVSYVYINSDNGSVYSMQSFDYELIKMFKIQVQATDHGSPSLSSNATVNVFIVDQNDNAPSVIHPSAATGSLSHQRMPRSAKAGHLVTKVTAVDADSGHNAWISYKLAEATDESLFSVNVYTGEVRTRRAVLEQDDSSQTLLVDITDNGEPAQSTTVTVSIILEDGLHEPILDQRHELSQPSKKTDQMTFYLVTSLISISVLSLVTCLILVIKCAKGGKRSSTCCMRRMGSDDFTNRNLQLQLNTDGPIKYVEVLGGDMLSHSQSFRSCLSPLSEFSDFTLVKPSSTLDFRDMFSMLDASLPDNAWTFESQQKAFVVALSDVNDNAPTFSQRSYSVDIAENNAPGTPIVTVSASDPDSGENARLSYTILESQVHGTSVASYAYINQDNGNIFSMRSLDYELMNAFKIHVQVRDAGTPPLTSNVTVHVFVVDQNDNPPVIRYPMFDDEDGMQLTIPASAPVGHLVGKIVAVDPDSGYNAWLSYSIPPGPDSALFRIEPHSGQLRTVRRLAEDDKEVVSATYSFTVVVKDNGEPQLSSSVPVTVTVEEPGADVGSDLHKMSNARPDWMTNSTLYLIAALAAVSGVFLITMLVLLVWCIRSRSEYDCCYSRKGLRSRHSYHQRNHKDLHLQLNTDGPIRYMEVVGGPQEPYTRTYRPCYSTLSNSVRSDFVFVKTPMLSHNNTLNMTLTRKHLTNSSNEVRVFFLCMSASEVASSKALARCVLTSSFKPHYGSICGME
ncbi:hypothetical protein ACEWY4_026794 [Coilia grayii]|uniref:Cadherin domain-containing protein n=1 Tax=Coilia grayii TaxID=363190 RepID=A0ABD1IST5_9TELE